jgi:hypothetical protein
MQPKTKPIPPRLLPEPGYRFNVSTETGELAYILIMTKVNYSEKTGTFKFFFSAPAADQFMEELSRANRKT